MKLELLELARNWQRQAKDFEAKAEFMFRAGVDDRLADELTQRALQLRLCAYDLERLVERCAGEEVEDANGSLRTG